MARKDYYEAYQQCFRKTKREEDEAISRLNKKDYKSENERFILQMKAGGSVVMARNLRAKKMKMEDVMNLFFLLDYQARRHPKAEKDAGGWFPCSIPEMEAWVYLPVGEQTRFLAKAEAAGFLERKTQGRPPKRFIRLNLAQLVPRLFTKTERQLRARKTGNSRKKS